ncbi:MAG: hypothetical protein QRY16_19570 [Enterobacterales bacterium endosymbiont of Blomia tropicalis]|uniref:hypothetical protein n=1 Tax=Mixta mediterraneensis TaxID=2758443 RepID=UPI001875B5B6|nr:hypothetical protein [Mixta mediterraneensis]MBE5253790.1 hypothetical protein [Mixta mediterraneensis]MDL4915886.1 hypothetical protein [Mixta mediterraneensis]
MPEETSITGFRLVRGVSNTSLNVRYHDPNTEQQRTETLTQQETRLAYCPLMF